MASRWVLLALVLVLAGCFRQASDSFERVDESLISATQVPDGMGQTGIDSGQVTMTVPPLVMFTSTPFVLPTDVESPTPTLTPTFDSFSGSSATQEGSSTSPIPLINPTNTPVFITPGLPSGPVVTSTPTPQPEGAAATPSGLITPTDFLAQPSEDCIYVVRPGDNLFRISVNNNTTLAALRAANPQISGDLIQPGDRLVLPDCEGAPASVSQPTTSTTQPTTGGEQRIHTVQAGETLGAIARIYGVTVLQIVQANNLADPNRLSVGQQLIIPSE